MDKVCKDHSPVIVTRKKSSSVVIVSQEDTIDEIVADLEGSR